MNLILGANWRTSLSGWIAILASAISLNPNLVTFLPERFRETIIGVAGLIAVVSGGAFAFTAKDKQVTGGNIPNDLTARNNSPPKAGSPLLIAGASLALYGLTGCSWIAAHQKQWNATLRVVEERALTVATRVLIGMAVNQSDKAFKADFLDSVAAGLRENAATVVSSEDVARIVSIWSPNDGGHWQTLAGQLGTVAADAFERSGRNQTAVVVENIASGLNHAAASARAAQE